MGAAAALHVHLQALQDAERAGDAAGASRLRRELVVGRLVERTLDPGAERSRLDAALLDRLGAELQRLDLHELALNVFTAGRAIAQATDDALWLARIELHAVESAVAVLDFAAAETVLRRRLALPPETPLRNPHALEKARTLLVAAVSNEDLNGLRVEALCSLARLLAATGGLHAAFHALSAALAALNALPSPWVSEPEVALFAGEVLLDRGDFPRFEALRLRAFAKNPSRAIQTKWRILEGARRYLQGDLSDAERLFRSVLETPTPFVLRSYLVTARWQRAQVLAVLNRIDEAEAECGVLEREAAAVFDSSQMRRILHARRTSAVTGFAPDESPRAILAVDIGGCWPPDLEAQPSAGRSLVLERSRERVRDEFARIGWEIMLDLHQGATDRAALRLLLLEQWRPSVESPLLHARFDRLSALVSYYRHDFVAARECAERAGEGYARLGMPLDEWDASRVRLWSLRGAGAPAADLEGEVRRNELLMRRVTAGLRHADRMLYKLNKWSVGDDAISLWCRKQQEGSDSGESWVTRWRKRRMTRRLLQRVLTVKRWETATPSDSQGAPPSTASVEAGADVFSVARDHVRLRYRRGEQLFEIARLSPTWVPAESAVLVYVSLPDRVEPFLVHRGGCELLRVVRPATRLELLDVLRQTVRSVAAEQRWREDLEGISRLADILGFQELERRLPDTIRRLEIVPDVGLEHVPFAALPFRGKPLVCSLTPYLVPTPRWTLRGFARPAAFRSGLVVDTLSQSEDNSFEHDTSAEVGGVKQVTGARAAILGRERSSIQQVLLELGNAEIVHFACHGEYDIDDPLASGLLLKDGWLTVRDLYEQRFEGLRMVIMGACWSADTAVLPGREMIGLPVAWLESGAETVISGLWELFDTPAESEPGQASPTAEFMKDLYEQFLVHTPADALADVQRRWAATRPTSDWAGYQLFARGIAPRPAVERVLSLVKRVVRPWASRGSRPVPHYGLAETTPGASACK